MYNYIVGLQYVIFLKKEIDLYDDLLPALSNVRFISQLFKEKSDKIILFQHEQLYKRLQNNGDHGSKLWNAVYSLRYSDNNDKKTRDNSPEHFLYRDVYGYQNLIKWYSPMNCFDDGYKEFLLSNNDYLEKVKDLEKEIINIQLNPNEQEILKKMNEIFKDIILDQGFQIIALWS